MKCSSCDYQEIGIGKLGNSALVVGACEQLTYVFTTDTDTQWRHKSKKSENLGRCGRQNRLWPYLKIWEWEWIFGRAVKAISSPCVRSPWFKSYTYNFEKVNHLYPHKPAERSLKAIYSEVDLGIFWNATNLTLNAGNPETNRETFGISFS